MASKKALIEHALGGDLSHQLGYPPCGDKPAQAGNHRRGASVMTVLTDEGPLRIQVPRDREGSFEPLLIAKPIFYTTAEKLPLHQPLASAGSA